MEEGLLLPLVVPNLGEGITKLSAGSHVVLLDPDGNRSPYLVPGKSWLLPDSYYRTALTKSKQLDICQPALDRCTETSLAWQERTYDALERASTQFDSDEGLVDTLTTQVSEWETRALTAESKNQDLKVQRNTAWAVTGGLVLGAVAVTAVAISG